jgi:hypothetical protein
MFISMPEFVNAEVNYRRERVRTAWRAGGRRKHVRVPRMGPPQAR